MSQQLGSLTRVFLAAALLAAGLTPVSRADDAGSLMIAKVGPMQGAQIYSHICQGCHMSQGEGATGAGFYPKLAKDRALASWRYVVLTVLGGKNDMPAFGASAQGMLGLSANLTDAQVADVVNYVRSHFGNRYRRHVTTAEVASVHKAMQSSP